MLPITFNISRPNPKRLDFSIAYPNFILDIDTVSFFIDSCATLLKDNPDTRHIHFNMYSLRHMDSSGAWGIYTLSEWLKERQGMLSVSKVPLNIKPLFVVTRLYRFVDVL